MTTRDNNAPGQRDAGPAEPRGVLERVLRASINNRGLVVLAVALLTLVGAYNVTHLPIDAVPDITNVQVQINTAVEGLPPVDVERLITFPIETAMAGLPNLEQTRSLSRYGLSQVTVVFEDGTDIYFARQLVSERLLEVRDNLPEGMAQPSMGPTATGLGEIFMWVVESEPGAVKEDGSSYTAVDLREIQDWVVKPQLATVDGVTEVNTIGGYRRQYEVSPDPVRLLAYGLTMHDVLLALERNNSTAGAGWIDHKGEQYLVGVDGRVHTVEDIGDVVVATRNGVPIHVHEVADVGMGFEPRTGAATENGREVVLGTAFMLIGENSRTVSHGVAERVEEVQKSLPPGVVIRPVYDRTRLVDATLHTVRTNLLEGAALVIAVLFLLLGNFRGAIIVALVIPLSMLFAVTGMVQNKISANLLSLGAIDFGIIVDGSVVMVENIVRRFATKQKSLGRVLTRAERLKEAYDSAREVARPTLFAMAIIMIVYLPILTLSGIEGKMFKPMAQVVLLALASALVLSMTFIPAAVALTFRGKVREKESPVLRGLRRLYTPTLAWALRFRYVTVALAALLIAASGLLAARLGSEFLPTLDEGDMTLHAIRIPGTSLTQAVEMQHDVETTLQQFPEVELVYSKIGTAEIANDPMPPHVSDVFVILKERGEWPDPGKTREELVADFEKELDLLPGNVYEYTQPIEMRFNELIAGIRSDVAVKVFGDDLDMLRETAHQIEEVVAAVPGASDVKTEQVSGLPLLTVKLDRVAISRYGLSVRDVQEVVSTAFAGEPVGEVFEGDRRFDIVVRLPESIRSDLRQLRNLPVPVQGQPAMVPTGAGAFHYDAEGHAEFIPLDVVADIELVEGPNQVSREGGKRRVVVQANVRGRDLGGFVAEAQERVDEAVDIPPGYWITWGGQFENLIAARERLIVVVPVALLLIFLLLFLAFGSAKDAIIVFTGVPLALTGGIVALTLRGIPFSISAAVGFVALSGVAVLNGVVMLSFVRRLRARGTTVLRALEEGCAARLRPVIMTALVASLGFVPMAIATGRGAEVQRPLATVVIGGIVSSTLLTLVVLPALYRIVHRDRREESAPGVD
jgi:cobalt-zinc-cadmium resistance protein CzcA